MTIRRVIVGLDPRPRGRPLLAAAAGLAEKMEAELVGLFVENVDLLHFAALPFAREVGVASAAARPMNVPAMERGLRALANEARRMLEGVAAQASVRCSFRVARGAEPAELLAEGQEADLIVLSLTPAATLPRVAGMRVVMAGDSDALRTALQSSAGVLVLAGEYPEQLADTLRALLEEQ